MRAKRIGPHRANLIVRRTKCKNICAADHANVSAYRSIGPVGAHEAAGRAKLLGLDVTDFPLRCSRR